MKNIQIIDSAVNCAYSVYQISSNDFSLIFPGKDQDVEFIEDLFNRLGDQKAQQILMPIWEQRIDKREIVGLHGTLFYQMESRKKFYPNKREADLDDASLQKKINEEG